MKLYFSKLTNGFYSTEIHGNNIPSDAVEITEDEHVALLNGQSEGKIIASDDAGRPVLVDAPGPTNETLWQAHQAEARSAIAASDTTLMRCYEAGISLPAEWVAYRKALRAIISTQSGDPAQQLPTRPDYPKGT